MEIDNNKLLKLYPPYDSVLGPYVRGDGRKHIVLNNSTLPKGAKGKTKTISFPKALVESNIGRILLSNETIDHYDRDKTNDNINNLIIRDRSEHSAMDAIRVFVDQVQCVLCGTMFTPTKAQRNRQVPIGETEPAGPFCSRSCSGLYGANVRYGGEIIKRREVYKVYYQEMK